MKDRDFVYEMLLMNVFFFSIPAGISLILGNRDLFYYLGIYLVLLFPTGIFCSYANREIKKQEKVKK